MNKFLGISLLALIMVLSHGGGLFHPLLLEPAQAQESSVVLQVDHLAVLDFEAKGGVSKDEASIITERFRAQLLRSGRFRIMERTKMQEILKEQGFQQSGLCDTTECSVEMGRLLSVNRILSGSVSKFGNIYSLSARIMDVEKGNILVEEYEDCECRLEELLVRSTNRLVAKLTGQIIPQDPPQIQQESNNGWIWIAGVATLAIVGGGITWLFLQNGSSANTNVSSGQNTVNNGLGSEGRNGELIITW